MTNREVPHSPRVGVLAVIGVGLIGGSFAAALRKAGAVDRVLGVGRTPGPLAQAMRLGLIDEVATLDQVAAQADLIFLATPVGTFPDLLERLLPTLSPDAVITDAGSTKADVVRAVYARMGDRAGQFIPGHPIAGAERTGPEAADATLYQGRNVILTPLPENESVQRQWLTRLWEQCGARVLTMAADVHDTVLASVSHVPHFLSSVFMAQVAASGDADVRLRLAGTGFRDFTRIAAGSPEMWRDIFLANRDAVLSELAQVRTVLGQAEEALAQQDGQRLFDLLERAALARRFWGSRSGLS